MSAELILAIDQGTTSTRAMLFDAQGLPVASDQEDFTQHFPFPGGVEHEPEDLWQTTLRTARRAIEKSRSLPQEIAAIGIVNQRETVVLWDKETGRPLHRAIVWQDRRTQKQIRALVAQNLEPLVVGKTGLLLDPYFSASKIAVILDSVEGARARAKDGKVLFGTVDSFLLWKLSGGRLHATDATNASRTQLYNIHEGAWDAELCELFDVPMPMLPEVRDCASDFGLTEAGLLGAPVPIRALAGDQQAAAIGQACFSPGSLKATYGTGCFVLMNTGADPVRSRHRLLTTIAYRLNGKTTYALEGAVFMAGASVQWLRDALQLIDSAPAIESLAREADPKQQLVLVPAFTGLGAPYWDSAAQGALFGMTRGSGRAEIARATLEAVGWQTRDLLEAMTRDAGQKIESLRVDGGMIENAWLMQFLADCLALPIHRPAVRETTAMGAARLAGAQVGLYPEPSDASLNWRPRKTFKAQADTKRMNQGYARWKQAVSATRLFAEETS